MTYNTLTEALESQGLIYLWPSEVTIAKGEIVSLAVGFGSHTITISVERRLDGLYEQPQHYTD